MRTFLIAALAVLLLAGCGEDESADSRSDAALPDEQAATTSAADEVTDQAGDETADKTAEADSGSEAPPPSPLTLELEDGTTLAYETFGQGDTAVVMLHCWGCNRQFWRHQVAPLVKAGYRVVTLDLPGHGEAGSERDEWRVGDYAQDVRGLVDDLGLEHVILVGHSMGGPVAAMTAPLLDERARGIVCVDTLHDAEFEWPEGMSERMARGFESDMAGALDGFLAQMFPPGTDPDLVAWIRDQALAADSEALVDLMRDFGSIDQAAMLDAVQVPVRCINARPEDERGMPTAVETNRRYVDFDVVLMDGVGHYPQLEAPERFNQHLLEMLAELSDSNE